MSEFPKEKVLVCCGAGPEPGRGSEPGKGFYWTLALSRLFEVHVICTRFAMERCQASGLCADWVFHPHEVPLPTRGGWRFYKDHYLPYCREILPICRKVIQEFGIKRLFQPTMGTFRMIPRFEDLGIEYYLGPLGGGESIPRAWLRDAGFPPWQWLGERLRPWLNRACIANPLVNRTLRRATALMATTDETKSLLRLGGGGRCDVHFPDVVDPADFPAGVVAIRERQMADVGTTIRLVFSARGLWWKGGQLAIQLVRYCRERKLDLRLTVVTDGSVGERWKRLAMDQGQGDRIEFRPMMPREQLFDLFLESHVFVYPSMHDSSSSALLEAYGCGLPSMTLGVGGIRMAACAEAGVNERAESIGGWITRCHARLVDWRREPRLWLEASAAAVAHSRQFGSERLVRALESLMAR